jgi:hypothetical protein
MLKLDWKSFFWIGQGSEKGTEKLDRKSELALVGASKKFLWMDIIFLVLVIHVI